MNTVTAQQGKKAGGALAANVRHCPECGAVLIAAPVLICAHCGKEMPLRCFTYRSASGLHIAECIDLDLLSQGETVEEAVGKLQDAMFTYLDVAFEGGSTKGLVLRKSPLSHRVRYHYHRRKCELLSLVRGLHGKHLVPANSEFKKYHLSHC